MSHAGSRPMEGRVQPDRSSVLDHERLTVVDHPICSDLLATVRDGRSNAGVFATAVEQLAAFLLWEATRDLPLRPASVPGFNHDPIEVERLASSPAGVVILRAGEAFARPFRALFPAGALYHLGVSRDEATLTHRVYSDNLSLLTGTPPVVLLLDPMLATGGSVEIAVARIREWYSGGIVVLALVAAPLGVQVVFDADERTRIVTAALDDRLNDQGYIIPGLGDAGDRFFGTG